MRSEVLDVAHHLVGAEDPSDEDEPTDDVTDGRPLGRVYEAGVGLAGRCEAKEIGVLGKHDAALTAGEREVVLVVGPERSGLGNREHVEAPAAEAVNDGARDVLVGEVADLGPRGALSFRPGVQLCPDPGRGGGPEPVGERLVVGGLAVDGFAVVVVVGQGGVDVAE